MTAPVRGGGTDPVRRRALTSNALARMAEAVDKVKAARGALGKASELDVEMEAVQQRLERLVRILGEQA